VQSDDDQPVSQPLSANEARAKCEHAADMIVNKHGGYWKWIGARHLRVFKDNGDAFLTLHIEALQ
jgi:hypothetical protein